MNLFCRINMFGPNQAHTNIKLIYLSSIDTLISIFDKLICQAAGGKFSLSRQN
jgi:hypothetical protein